MNSRSTDYEVGALTTTPPRRFYAFLFALSDAFTASSGFPISGKVCADILYKLTRFCLSPEKNLLLTTALLLPFLISCSAKLTRKWKLGCLLYLCILSRCLPRNASTSGKKSFSATG